MNKAHIRTGVLIIIVIAAVGIGVYLGMGSGSISRLPASGGKEFVPDPISADDETASVSTTEQTTEPATEQTTEQKKEIDDKAKTGSGIGERGQGQTTPEMGSGTGERGQAQIREYAKLSQTPHEIEPDPSALAKAADDEDYDALGKILAEIYKKYPQGKKEFVEIESRAYVKATSYLDQEKNVEKARAAADAVYSKYPFGWRFKYLRVRALERLGRDAFAAGDLAGAEKHALTMLGMEFRPEGANLMADIYLKRIDVALAKGDKAGAQSAYDEIKDYEVSPDRRAALDERLGKILGL